MLGTYRLIILLILILFFIKIFKVYFILLIILNRGIIVQNNFWWKISDIILPHYNHRYDNILDEYRNGTHYINLIKIKFRVINDINEINKILYNSPIRYRTGYIKYNYFKNFMPYNIGVIAQSDDKSVIRWQQMRKFNEHILDTGITYSQIIDNYKKQIIDICLKTANIMPMSREYFEEIGKKIVKLLLFGHTNVSDIILPDNKLFPLPNIFSLLFNDDSVLSNKKKWKKIIKSTYINPISLIGKIKNLDDDNLEVFEQIPHWIFPIYGTITSNLIRALLLDKNYNKKNIPTRNILLETMRLYNPVTTLFRKDINTNEEILIMTQMILRDKKYFNNPHSFYPERFNDKKLEYQIYSLMFSQGPQICPGKNFILYLIEILFDTIKPIFKSNKILDCYDLPDSLNPFDLF